MENFAMIAIQFLTIFQTKIMALTTESNLAKSPLTPFIEALLMEANLTALPEEYKENYQRRLEGQFIERLGFAAMRALPESDVPRATELAGKEKFEDLTTLFQKSIPDFPKIVEETMRSFREDFLASTKASRTKTAV